MDDLTLRRELVHVIRKVKREVVFCGDPNLVIWGPNRINHPDHRAAALAALAVAGLLLALALRPGAQPERRTRHV